MVIGSGWVAELDEAELFVGFGVTLLLIVYHAVAQSILN